jgi:uncharacterized protein (DUF433 family)
LKPTETVVHVPVHTDTDGVVRVAGTRVTFETIVGAFEAGATPEEIAQQYSSVPLRDIYAVIAYCLQHESEVRAYLHIRQQLAAAVRQEVERRSPVAGIRERLLARRGSPLGAMRGEFTMIEGWERPLTDEDEDEAGSGATTSPAAAWILERAQQPKPPPQVGSSPDMLARRAVPTSAVLVHQLQVFDSKGLESPTTSDRTDGRPSGHPDRSHFISTSSRP